jgi:uncharacterized damage-inducible protein DinB
MDRIERFSGTREFVEQLWEGHDFEPPARMLAGLSPEQAATVPFGCPYSIAGQVAHMRLWQDRWLAKIEGRPVSPEPEGPTWDWPRTGSEEWESTRDGFLNGLEKVRRVASDAGELRWETASGLTVDTYVVMIVEHNIYHLGQIGLLRQLLGAWPPPGSGELWDESSVS